LPFATHVVDQLALPAKRHGFRRITSCHISLSSGLPVLAGQALPEWSKFQADARSDCRSRFVSIQAGEFSGLNLLCYVFQVRRESVRDLGRIISRLCDVVAHLENAREHRQYWD